MLVSCHVICETCFSTIQLFPTIFESHFTCFFLWIELSTSQWRLQSFLFVIKEKVLHKTILDDHQTNEKINI
jgi:hypothetical protein